MIIMNNFIKKKEKDMVIKYGIKDQDFRIQWSC